jgi:hypothetical protein
MIVGMRPAFSAREGEATDRKISRKTRMFSDPGPYVARGTARVAKIARTSLWPV